MYVPKQILSGTLPFIVAETLLIKTEQNQEQIPGIYLPVFATTSHFNCQLVICHQLSIC